MPIFEGVVCRPPGGAADSDELWSLVLHLAPWCDAEGRLDQEELRVEQVIGSSSQLKQWMKRLAEGDAIQVTAPRAEPDGNGRFVVHTSQISKTTMSPRLRTAEKERARPLVVRDVLLGRLELDRRLDAFVGSRKLAGRRYRLWVHREPRTDPARQVCAIRPRVLAFERSYDSIRAATVLWMAQLYNDNWRGDRRAFTIGQLERRLRLSTLQVHGTERITASFGTGNLFFEHGIEVRLGPDAEIREILLA